MTARLDVLCAGYAAERVASTVVLIRAEGTVIVVDPAWWPAGTGSSARWRGSASIRPTSATWCSATIIPTTR
jgi:hypothetical protein